MKAETLRLHLYVTAVNRTFECVLPAARSLNDCMPYLITLLIDQLEPYYQLDDETLFIESASGVIISRTVTLSRQNLMDGMRLIVY